MTQNSDYNAIKKGEKLAQEIVSLMRDRQLELKIENCPELMKYMHDPDIAKLLDALLSQESFVSNIENFKNADKISRRDTLIEVLNAAKIRHRRMRLMRKVVAIASVSAMLIIGLIILSTNNYNPIIRSLSYETISDSTDKPIIIFSNGERVELTKEVVQEMTPTNTQSDIKLHQRTYNTVIIPRMFDYMLTLADGSQIHMNANSELKYSTTLVNDSIREVFLSGEAYFKVANNMHPFVVNVNGMKVRVYGTEFNINSHNRGVVEMVLVEGSVSVTTENQKLIKLSPGQLLQYDKNNDNHSLKNVDTFAYTAWRSGFFYCQESHINELLENISAWYGVNFEYNEQDLDSEALIVSVSLNRNHTLIEILNSIESITGLKFIKERSCTYRIKR